MDIWQRNKGKIIEPCIASVCENVSYAVPIRYVVRCILILGLQLKDSIIFVDGEEAKILILCSPVVLEKVQHETVMCVLYRNENGQLVAIFMGNHYHSNSPCLTALPVEQDLERCREISFELDCGVYAYAEKLPSGENLLILHPNHCTW